MPPKMNGVTKHLFSLTTLIIIPTWLHLAIFGMLKLTGSKVSSGFEKFQDRTTSLQTHIRWSSTTPDTVLQVLEQDITTRLTALSLVNSGNESKLAKTLSKLGLSCKLGKSEYIRALLTNGSNKSSAFNIVGKVGAIEADSYVRLHLVLIYFVCFNLFTLERSLILAMRKQKKIIIETLSSLLFPHN